MDEICTRAAKHIAEKHTCRTTSKRARDTKGDEVTRDIQSSNPVDEGPQGDT